MSKNISNKDNFLTQTGNVFVFNSFKCDCKINTVYDSEGVQHVSFCIKELEDEPIRFAYQGQTGLILVDATGKVISTNVISSLLSLGDTDIKGHADFFNNYGFLIKISQKEYKEFEIADIFALTRTFRTTVKLLDYVQAERKEYQKILALVFQYFFQEDRGVENGHNDVSTGTPLVVQELQHTNRYNTCDTYLKTNNSDDLTQHYYEVPDTIYPPSFKLPYYTYQEEIAPQTDCSTIIYYNYSDVAKVYVNAMDRLYDDMREEVSFFYHFQRKVAKIVSVTGDGICTYENPSAFSTLFANNFDDHLKAALLRIAKYVIKDSIDAFTDGIVPEYDLNSMSGKWEIPSLFSALYFSIFYMQSKYEVYRHCANPVCINYFAVSTTNSRKKYCCPECMNANAQRNLRYRRKQQKK